MFHPHRPFSDAGGIYKGRLHHRERAREIEDTHDTKVDLPVDHRKVETIEEENLYGRINVSALLPSEYVAKRKGEFRKYPAA